MSQDTLASDSKQPAPDRAVFNAFFPSPYSLSQFTAPRTGAQRATYSNAQRNGRWKVLMVATDLRYMTMANGTKFSTGNHPVETLLPMYHMDQAGFEIDIATPSGYPVALEMWAMPGEDEIVQETFQKYLPKLEHPMALREAAALVESEDSPYLGVFIPGGHGAMLGLPDSDELQRILDSVMSRQRLLVALCHGPAALVAAARHRKTDAFPLKGYELCAFPDALDRQTPAIGYIPGPMPWYMGERLTALGMKIVNDDITGRCHQDRNLLTGDSPLASDALGAMAARALLAACATA